MKKIILFLLSYFLLGCFSVSANRYGAHLVGYAAGGTVTSCTDDGQGAAGYCAQIGGSPAVGSASAPSSGPSGVVSAGNIICLYWDSESPTISDNYGSNGVWTNGTRTITLSPVDTGGAGISTTKWCEGAGCNPATGTVGTSITKGPNYSNTIRYQTWDIAGNASAIGQTVVMIESVLPTVSDNYAYNNVWKSFASQTITLTSGDTGGSGLSTTKWCAGGACNPATGTVGTSITINANYNNTIRYQSYDVAGNASAIGSFIVQLDTTVPTISDNYAYNGVWTNGTRTITLSPVDTGGAGISTTMWCEGVGCNPAAGTVGTSITKGPAIYNNTIRYQTWDVSGNASAIGQTVVMIENDAPTVSNDYAYNNVWKNFASQTITLTPGDAGGSGLSTTKWCAGGACNPATGTVGTSITINANYNNTIRYQTWDVSGNASAIGSFIVQLDTTIPTITNNYPYNGVWINGTRTITLSPVDTGGSGISTAMWCEGVGCNPATGNVGISITEGPAIYNNTIRYQTWDVAGNASIIGQTVVMIENIPPTNLYTYPFDGTWKDFSSYTLTLTGSDANSGINSIKWCEWNTCNVNAGSLSTTITKNSIYNNTIKYRIRDNAGNYTDSSFKLMLDGPIIYSKVKDNDSNARSSIVGYVTKTGSLENIFWNNTISNTYIDANNNNSDNAFEKIGDVSSGKLKIAVDKNSTIRVIKFDRARYNLNKELYVLDAFEGTVTAQTGYIQKVSGSLTLNGTIGADTYVFDFQHSDYAIFVKNNGIGILNYTLVGDTGTKGIYINPIDDSYAKEIRILASHIILSNGIYIGKQSEYIKLK